MNDLAKKAGVNSFTVVNVEENGATLRHHEAQLIANALGVSLATLGQVEL